MTAADENNRAKQMIVANLFFIKNSNGLYYYGVDYISAIYSKVTVILVRPALLDSVRSRFPSSNVVACKNLFVFIKNFVTLYLKGAFFYTPTPHPIPFVSKQMVVVHDPYPFRAGFASTVRKYLLKISLLSSKCKVGFINTSEGYPFILRMGVPHSRTIFAPNCFPVALGINKHVISNKKVIGLLGTDSKKKNYDLIFDSVRGANLVESLKFVIYGHSTNYYRNLLSSFPDIDIVLSHSDITSLPDFMATVDIVASAAEQEGFGRPIATALLSGIQVELLDRPVFREFFTGGARFHSDIVGLVNSFVEAQPPILKNVFTVPSNLKRAFEDANHAIMEFAE